LSAEDNGSVESNGQKDEKCPQRMEEEVAFGGVFCEEGNSPFFGCFFREGWRNVHRQRFRRYQKLYDIHKFAAYYT